MTSFESNDFFSPRVRPFFVTSLVVSLVVTGLFLGGREYGMMASLRSLLSAAGEMVGVEEPGEVELVVVLPDSDFVSVSPEVTTNEVVSKVNFEEGVIEIVDQSEEIEVADASVEDGELEREVGAVPVLERADDGSRDVFEDAEVVTLRVREDRVDEVRRRYKDEVGALLVEENGIVETTASPNDELYLQQWALENQSDTDIDAGAAWDITQGTSSVIIAVLDSGVDNDHPDLAGKLTSGYNFVENNTNYSPVPDRQDNDGDGAVDEGVEHGTHVASIAAAATNNGQGVSGVGWNARIMPIKVLNDEGAGTFSDVAQGITWAVDRGADVVNLSLSGPYSSIVQSSIDYAYSKGVIVVASAGNSNQVLTSGSRSPVCNDGGSNKVIGVAALDIDDRKANFSNYGSCIDVSAPGQGIWGAVYQNSSQGYTESYKKLSGTSMSAPIVSGVVALVRAQHPSWSAAQVRDRVLATADSVEARNSSTLRGKLGRGRVNAGDAVYQAASIGSQKILVAAGPGGGPQVRGFSRTGTPTATNFFAFGESFRGGVRIAAGDVDGDGVDEIIVGARRGGGPHVRVFERDGRLSSLQFFAFDPSFRGGLDVSAGDVDGDGVEEIAVSQARDGQAWIKVYDRSNRILAYFNAFGAPEVGASISFGDVDGDGKDELVVGAGPGGGPQIRVYDIGVKPVSGPNQGAVLKGIQFFAFHPDNRSGIDVDASDIDGDGKTEIIVSQREGDEAFIKTYRYNSAKTILGGFRAYAAGVTTGAYVSGGDIDDDGRGEIVVGPGAGGGPHVRAFEADGVPVSSVNFFAFGTSFRGGVSVAVTE